MVTDGKNVQYMGCVLRAEKFVGQINARDITSAILMNGLRYDASHLS